MDGNKIYYEKQISAENWFQFVFPFFSFLIFSVFIMNFGDFRNLSLDREESIIKANVILINERVNKSEVMNNVTACHSELQTHFR